MRAVAITEGAWTDLRVDQSEALDAGKVYIIYAPQFGENEDDRIVGGQALVIKADDAPVGNQAPSGCVIVENPVEGASEETVRHTSISLVPRGTEKIFARGVKGNGLSRIGIRRE